MLHVFQVKMIHTYKICQKDQPFSQRLLSLEERRREPDYSMFDFVVFIFTYVSKGTQPLVTNKSFIYTIFLHESSP